MSDFGGAVKPLEEFPDYRIAILGVPFDEKSSYLRGASGGPAATTQPPFAPAPGPRSTSQSALHIVCSSCSTTTTECLPARLRRSSTVCSVSASVMPAARLQILPGVGHLPMIERPEETAELYLQFLGTLPGSETGSTEAL